MLAQTQSKHHFAEINMHKQGAHRQTIQCPKNWSFRFTSLVLLENINVRTPLFKVFFIRIDYYHINEHKFHRVYSYES